MEMWASCNAWFASPGTATLTCSWPFSGHRCSTTGLPGYRLLLHQLVQQAIDGSLLYKASGMAVNQLPYGCGFVFIGSQYFMQHLKALVLPLSHQGGRPLQSLLAMSGVICEFLSFMLLMDDPSLHSSPQGPHGMFCRVSGPVLLHA